MVQENPLMNLQSYTKRNNYLETKILKKGIILITTNFVMPYHAGTKKKKTMKKGGKKKAVKR